MLTVWERRRLKRDTLEPEEMHTAGGGGWVSVGQLARGSGYSPAASGGTGEDESWLLG